MTELRDLIQEYKNLESNFDEGGEEQEEEDDAQEKNNEAKAGIWKIEILKSSYIY